MKIALFGGSFDPPHLGHDTIVKTALNKLDIDKLIIMPTFISPFKSEFSAPPELRLNWISRIWGDLDRVLISDFEISQARPVPTIETVKHLINLYNPSEIYLIIGADHAAGLHKWHEYNELKKLVKIVIATRDNFIVPCDVKTFDMQVGISSSQIRQGSELSMLDARIKDEIIKFYKGKK